METHASQLNDGRYSLVEPIGSGGVATVFRAYDHSLAKWRAIKVLRSQYAARKSFRRRFASEARMMAQLEHPNIVRIYDVGNEGVRPFIVMEILKGGSLLGWQSAHGTMAPRLACEAVLQICAGLSHAHAQGVVHRDVKPHNVLITEDGTLRVSDFGIARTLDDAGTTDVTRPGAVMGTQGYMAPEAHADAHAAGVPADVYAVGATLYALLTARQPGDLFMASKDPELLEGIHPALADVIAHATSYKAGDRPESVDAMADRLLACMPELPPLAADHPVLGRTRFPTPALPLARSHGPVVEHPSERSASATILPPYTDALSMATLNLVDAVARDELRAFFGTVEGDLVDRVQSALDELEAVPVEDRTAEVRATLAEAHRVRDEAVVFRTLTTLHSMQTGMTDPGRPVPWVRSALAGLALAVLFVVSLITLLLILTPERSFPTAPVVPAPRTVELAAPAPVQPAAAPEVASPAGDEAVAVLDPSPAPADRQATPPVAPARIRAPVAAPAPAVDPVVEESEPAVVSAQVEPPEPEPAAPPEPEVVEVEVEVPAPPSSGRAAEADASRELGLFARVGTDVTDVQLRRVLLGRDGRWPDGTPALVVLPPAGSEAMRWLCSELGVREQTLLRGWAQRRFQGAGTPHIDAPSFEAAAAAVSGREGAISVLPAGLAPHGARHLGAR